MLCRFCTLLKDHEMSTRKGIVKIAYRSKPLKSEYSAFLYKYDARIDVQNADIMQESNSQGFDRE